MAGQPICGQLTFWFGSARTKVPGHARSSFGPEMGGGDPVLHYSSDAGVAGCRHGGPRGAPPNCDLSPAWSTRMCGNSPHYN